MDLEGLSVTDTSPCGADSHVDMRTQGERQGTTLRLEGDWAVGCGAEEVCYDLTLGGCGFEQLLIALPSTERGGSLRRGVVHGTAYFD